MKPSRFNIRVYGIWIFSGQLLVNEEIIRGQRVIKLPGGGMALGEGPIDALKREWMEELGIEIDVTEHFYTTHFFQQSAFDDSQVISIYYLISADPHAVIQNTEANEHTYWMPLSEINAKTFTLPIDAYVGGLLSQLPG